MISKGRNYSIAGIDLTFNNEIELELELELEWS